VFAARVGKSDLKIALLEPILFLVIFAFLIQGRNPTGVLRRTGISVPLINNLLLAQLCSGVEARGVRLEKAHADSR
jgi:hypothetical protein